ncbi:hypothetical protein EVB91_291 [Rhizobium phage RHph_I1_18]|nr:hypothetical protein EVB91_291 [Rhizobium phage RHph_I1_18]
MKDLIEVLTIALKYVEEDSYKEKYPTHCEHDVMYLSIPNNVSDEDRARLSELSFDWSDDEESFCSYRFGSC